MTTLSSVNSQEAVQARFEQGLIPRTAPLVVIASRSILILLVQGLVYMLFLQLKVPNASVTIRNCGPYMGRLWISVVSACCIISPGAKEST